jgi:Leucine-rich repeat (LRR) protein
MSFRLRYRPVTVFGPPLPTVTVFRPPFRPPFFVLTNLYLGINKLKDIGVDTFENLRNLKCLSLSKNQLKYINPLTFVNLTNLRHLELDYNELEYIELMNLENLQDLCLNNNRLRKISSKTLRIFNMTKESVKKKFEPNRT